MVGLHTGIFWTEIIPSSDSSTIQRHVVSEGERDRLFDRKRDANQFSLFFFGQIRYGDLFGNEYVGAFCQVRDRNTGTFKGIGGSEWNYRRKIDKSTKLKN